MKFDEILFSYPKKKIQMENITTFVYSIRMICYISLCDEMVFCTVSINMHMPHLRVGDSVH